MANGFCKCPKSNPDQTRTLHVRQVLEKYTPAAAAVGEQAAEGGVSAKCKLNADHHTILMGFYELVLGLLLVYDTPVKLPLK